jgi:hypothetical protein
MPPWYPVVGLYRFKRYPRVQFAIASLPCTLRMKRRSPEEYLLQAGPGGTFGRGSVKGRTALGKVARLKQTQRVRQGRGVIQHIRIPVEGLRIADIPA